MTWTDERVALLKKLWMEGLSASQIAGELSGGVTRNAVIGKVHRLKLSARAKPASAAPRAKTPRSSAPRRSSGSGIGRPSSGGSGASSPRRTTSAPMLGATALKMDEHVEMEAEVQVDAKVSELFIPVEERVSLLELNENTCKWPIGDPVHSDFHFCGRPSDEAKPYCDFHSRRAYHQVDRKKR